MKHRDQILVPQALLREAIGDLLDYWTFKYDGVMRGDDRLPEELLQKSLENARWSSIIWPTWLAIDHLVNHPEIRLEQYDYTIVGWEDAEVRLALHQFHGFLRLALQNPLSSDLFEIELQEVDYATWRERELPRINVIYEAARMDD